MNRTKTYSDDDYAFIDKHEVEIRMKIRIASHISEIIYLYRELYRSLNAL